MNILTVLAVGFWLSAGSVCGVEPDITRESIVAKLKHDEGLVRSMHCTYEHVVLETTPSQIEKIREVHGKNANRFIIDTNDSRVRSANVEFWRKGVKQREERILLDERLAQNGPAVAAFDGQIFRSLAKQQDQGLAASIMTAESAQWENRPRNDPISFVYLYYEKPFSQVIAEARSFSCKRISRGTRTLHAVSIDCAGTNGDSLDIVFDDHLLPLERVKRLALASGVSLPNCKFVIEDYKEYPTPSGEAILFPQRVRYVGYNGVLSTGESLEVRMEEFRIKHIEFNPEIPDSVFELEIPATAHIYDGITGVGWLPAGSPLPSQVPGSAHGYNRVWTAVAGAIAFTIVAVVVIWLKRANRTRKLASE
jgi:hypothetical protein